MVYHVTLPELPAVTSGIKRQLCSVNFKQISFHFWPTVARQRSISGVDPLPPAGNVGFAVG